jgi:hypothetical protein
VKLGGTATLLAGLVRLQTADAQLVGRVPWKMDRKKILMFGYATFS